METFIGIDLGTSGCRGCLIDNDKNILAEHRLAFPEPDVQGRQVEQSPDCWLSAVVSVLKKLCSHPEAKQLRSISVDGTSSTLLLTDEYYEPVAAALMYNDSRAIEQAQRVASIAPPEASVVYGSSSSLSKLLWLYEQHPDASHALHQADFISGKLSGNYVSDFNNCLKLGFDPVTESWPEWMHAFGFSLNLLPQVCPPGTRIGQLKTELKQLLGLNRNVAIISGTTDSIAGFLATGAEIMGDTVISIGSTMAIKVLNDSPVNRPEYGIYSHKINNQWLVGGASNAGTTVLRQLFDDAQLQQLSKQLDFTNPTGLNYYPIPVQGERFPVNNPDQQPVLSPRPDSDVVFLQGILESLTTIEQECYSTLVSIGVKTIKRIYTLGGATKNRAWMQYRDQQLGKILLNPRYNEACYGVALLARQGYHSHKTTTT